MSPMLPRSFIIRWNSLEGMLTCQKGSERRRGGAEGWVKRRPLAGIDPAGNHGTQTAPVNRCSAAGDQGHQRKNPR